MKMPKCARKTLFLHLKRMNMMKVQIINRGHQPLPAYATPESAGLDLRANINKCYVLRPWNAGLPKVFSWLCQQASRHRYVLAVTGIETWHSY